MTGRSETHGPAKPDNSPTPHRGEVHACNAGVQATVIFENQRYLVRREDLTGGYIVTAKRGGSVYIQPGDDAAAFADGLQDVLQTSWGGTIESFLSPYFD